MVTWDSGLFKVLTKTDNYGSLRVGNGRRAWSDGGSDGVRQLLSTQHTCEYNVSSLYLCSSLCAFEYKFESLFMFVLFVLLEVLFVFGFF